MPPERGRSAPKIIFSVSEPTIAPKAAAASEPSPAQFGPEERGLLTHRALLVVSLWILFQNSFAAVIRRTPSLARVVPDRGREWTRGTAALIFPALGARPQIPRLWEREVWAMRRPEKLNNTYAGRWDCVHILTMCTVPAESLRVVFAHVHIRTVASVPANPPLMIFAQGDVFHNGIEFDPSLLSNSIPLFFWGREPTQFWVGKPILPCLPFSGDSALGRQDRAVCALDIINTPPRTVIRLGHDLRSFDRLRPAQLHVPRKYACLRSASQ